MSTEDQGHHDCRKVFRVRHLSGGVIHRARLNFNNEDADVAPM